ncbi:MAG: hypothetical protein AB7G21_06200 [Dehalococcoidia bacterium]
MSLNRTLRQLRNARERRYPEMYEYDASEGQEPPAGVRYMTLTEAKSLECNLCGQCCGSQEADLEGFQLRQYTFGGIPKHQWKRFNGGQPLIIPLTPSGLDRAWRPKDADDGKPPAFRCEALQHHPDGTTRCGLWLTGRPSPCDAYPVNTKHYPDDLRRGAYVLLNTQYQRLCTWVDTLVCPDDSVILGWRRKDGTLRGRLTSAQRAFVARVFREAYRDLFPDEDGTLPLREWRKIRAEEAAWR